MKKKIIVVDDSADNLEVLKFLLEGEGYEVTCDNNGDYISRGLVDNPDLVILDIQLPHLNGNEICLKLKNDPATAHFPVMLLSAETYYHEKFLLSKADAYMEKPYDLKDMIQRVKKLVL